MLPRLAAHDRHRGCFREPGTAAAAVAVDQLRKHVDEDTCLLWVDCDDPSEEEIAALAEQLGIHHLTAEDLVNANQRTKLERFADHFHVALHDLCSTTRCCRTARLTSSSVTVGSCRSVTATARRWHRPARRRSARFERQRGEHGSNDEGFLLWAILDVIVDRYFDVTSDRRTPRRHRGCRVRPHADVIPREIFTLRRSIVVFRRAVGPLREVLAQLLRKEVECIGDEAIAHIQDVYDHTLRVLDLIESQRELLTGLLEGQLAVQSNQMNKS